MSASRRSIPYIAALVLLTLLLGVGSAVAAIHVASRRGSLRIGPWVASLDVGSSGANMYLRAAIAVHALFVLNRNETIYFRAHTDGAGRALDSRCSYEIRGRALPARWWSVTAYANDDFLIPNAADRYSFTMANIAYEPDGTFVIRASPQKQQGNWLPLGSAGRVSLTLRLYNPTPEAAAHPESLVLPTITGSCP
jgi:hypothetical protein